MSEEFDSLKKRKNQNSKIQHRLKADNSTFNIQHSKLRLQGGASSIKDKIIKIVRFVRYKR